MKYASGVDATTGNDTISPGLLPRDLGLEGLLKNLARALPKFCLVVQVSNLHSASPQVGNLRTLKSARSPARRGFSTVC